MFLFHQYGICATNIVVAYWKVRKEINTTFPKKERKLISKFKSYLHLTKPLSNIKMDYSVSPR
jgi:hypothetical protein